MAPSQASDNQSTSTDEMLAELVEEVTRQIERGQEIDTADYEEKYPEYAGQLRRLIPALRALDEVGLSAASSSSAREVTQGSTSVRGELGDFRILGEIGRGGMGVVYEAEQISLGRRVALKVLPFAAMLDASQLSRFKNEARAAAALDHPNIVAVHSVGTERGVHYYAMQLVDGQSLAQVIREWQLPGGGGRMEETSGDSSAAPSKVDTAPVAALSTVPFLGTQDRFRSVARLGVQAAQALDHAHWHGIVHRDVKPANLLVNNEGKLWVTDFGLARIESDASFTMTGDILGTLRYMSPEQAQGTRAVVDHRTDIYSLGATLYELLALQPTFQSEDRQELFRKIAQDEPVSLSKINPSIPGDLVTIVGKAMEKRPEDRYLTAQEIGDDLTSFLQGRPIQAKRPSLVERGTKWSRRHKAVTWSTALLVLLISFGSTLGAVLLSAAYQSEAEQRRRADDAAKRAQGAQTNEEAARETAEQERDESHRNLYLADMRLAPRYWETAQIGYLHEALDRYVPSPGRSDVRGWEWYYFLSQCHRDLFTLRGHADLVSAVDWSPDGSQLASASRDRSIKIWDPNTGKLVRTLYGHHVYVFSLAFSPDGKRLASSGRYGNIGVWDPATGQRLLWFTQAFDWIERVEWRPDGRQLATTATGTGKVWDISADTPRTVLTEHDVKQVCWSPNGKRLALSRSGGDRGIEIRDAASGEPMLTLSASSPFVFSPDAARIAAPAGDGTVKIWDATTGAETLALGKHRGGIRCIAYSRDGHRVATGSDDHTVKIWDAAIGDLVCTLQGHARPVTSVSWSPDGRRVASASHDQTVKIWEVIPDQDEVRLPGPANESCALRFSADGQRVAGAGEDHTVCVWDIDAPERPIVLAGHTDSVTCVAWSRDGRLASCGDDMTVKIWDVDAGREVLTLNGHTGKIWAAAWSPVGTHLATASSDKTLKIWDVATAKVAHTFSYECWDHRVAWNPGGDRVAAHNGFDLVIYDTVTGKEAELISLPPEATGPMSWSPDGARFAARVGSNICLWDTSSWQRVAKLSGHSGVSDLAWNADAARILSVSAEGLVRVWDSSTAQEITSLSAGENPVPWWGGSGEVLALATRDSQNGNVSVVRLNPLRGFAFAEDPEYLLDMAQRRAADGRDEDAVEILRELDSRHPNVLEYRLALASRLATVDISEAIAILEKLNRDQRHTTQDRADLTAACRTVAELSCKPADKHTEEREFDQAIRACDEAIRLDPDYAVAYVKRGEAHREMNDFNKAIADYTEAIRLNPDYVVAYFRRGDAHEAMDNFNKAIADYTEAIRLNPDYAVAYFRRGTRYNKKGDFDAAVADLSEAIRLEPKQAAAYNNRGYGYIQKGDFDAAIADLSEAIRLNPERAEAYDNRGYGYNQKDDFDAAIVDYSEAIRLNRESASLFRRRGISYGGKGDYGKAVADFRKAIELEPDDARAYYGLALAHLGAGEIEEYRKACASMLEQFGDTDDPELATPVAFTCLLMSDAVGDLNPVVQLAEMAVKARAEPFKVTTLGAALFRNARYEPAIKCLSDLSEEWEGGADYPNRTLPAYTWFFLAMAHEHLGHHEEAKKMLQIGAQWMDTAIQEHEDGTDRLLWNRQLTLKLFRAEAEALLDSSGTSKHSKTIPDDNKEEKKPADSKPKID